MTYKISEKTGELVGMMMVNDDNDIMMITSEGVIIRIHAEDINIIGRNTSGVRLMRTTDTNLIVSCAKTEKEEDVPQESNETETVEVVENDVIINDSITEASENEGPDYEAGQDILNKLDIE